MGSKPKKQTVGYKYYVGLHMVLIHGPADKLTKINVDKREAWTGGVSSGSLTINKTGLFGGEDREGGISGEVDFLPGEPTQGVNAYLASKLGSLVPAFRGVASVVLKQVYLGTNSYLKPWSFKLQRILKKSDGSTQWYPETAALKPFFAIPQVEWSQVTGIGVDEAFGDLGVKSLVYANGLWVAGHGAFGDIRFTSDGTGQTGWQYANAPFENYGVYDILPQSGSWIVSGVGAIAQTDDLEGAWDQLVGDGILTPVNPFEGVFIESLAQGGGKLVAAGESVLAYYLGDLDWHVVTNPVGMTGSINDVEYFDGVWVMVADNKVYFSTDDLVTWQNSPNPFELDPNGSELRCVKNFNGAWVICGGNNWNSGPKICYSYNLLTWSQATINSTVTTIYDIAYDGNTFVAGGGSWWTAGGYNFRLVLIAADLSEWFPQDDSSVSVTEGTIRAVATNYDGWAVGLGTRAYDGTKWLSIGSVVMAPQLPIPDQTDMNPAHIIRECLTDPMWGMGYPESDVDADSFTLAANTLFNERLGLSLLWDKQVPLEDFIAEITRHIDGALYVDRTSGKFVLKLIRKDYSEAGLLELNETNVSKVDNFNRVHFGELTTSVTANFWNHETGETSSVSSQDIALSQMQQADIATTVQYPGVTNGILAARLCQRDLTALSRPRASCTVYANREAKGLTIGTPFKLTWPDYGMLNTVMRVTGMAYGDGRTNRIKITCIEDVFDTPDTAYVIPSDPIWEDPITDPVPVANQITVETPYFELVQVLGQTEVDAALARDSTLGYVTTSAGKPSAASLNARVFTDPGTGYEDIGELDFCPTAVIGSTVGVQGDTITLSLVTDAELITPGTFAQVNDEIVGVVSLVGLTLTVKRAVLDSVPRAHAIGDVILFWDAYAVRDETAYADGEIVSVKIAPITGLGQLPVSSAAPQTVTLDQRAFRPYPPGNIKFNGEYFPVELLDNGITLSWATRNRLQQTGADLVAWGDASVTPEDGLTTNIRVYNASTEALISTHLNKVGESFEIPPIGFTGLARFEVTAERDSLESLYKFTHEVDLTYNPPVDTIRLAVSSSDGIRQYTNPQSTFGQVSIESIWTRCCNWSADGTYLGVGLTSSPFFRMYKRTGDTLTNLGSLPSHPGVEISGVSWHPSGNYVALVSTSSPFLWLYRREGDTFVKLANPGSMFGAAYECAWSPSGGHLAVASHASPRIHVYSFASEVLTKLANPATLPTSSALGIGWSPDGNYIAIGFNASPWLFLYSLSGATLTKLANPSVAPTGLGRSTKWSADGNYLAVAHDVTPFLTMYSWSAGVATKITGPVDLPPGGTIGDLSWLGSEYLATVGTLSPFVRVYSHSAGVLTKVGSEPLEAGASYAASLVMTTEVPE